MNKQEIEKAIELLKWVMEAPKGRTLSDRSKEMVYPLAISALTQQLNNGWIQVSEQLPEKEGMYLITSKVLANTEVQYAFFQLNIQRFICNGRAVAWKPLPQPYKEVSD